ncbi:hypothetical protein [Ralstonia sp.]|uniref:hypothetical protein n=1 Tax=Ralstonia sp. TaxID=54061 RepID=UPI00257CD9B6|nr:hypothetical protein [Ralstonia sp.]
MPTEDEDGFRVTIKLDETMHTQEICGMLRGLLYVNGNSNGQSKKDADFKRGVIIEFGTPPMARKLVGDIEALFRRRVRRRLHVVHHR